MDIAGAVYLGHITIYHDDRITDVIDNFVCVCLYHIFIFLVAGGIRPMGRWKELRAMLTAYFRISSNLRIIFQLASQRTKQFMSDDTFRGRPVLFMPYSVAKDIFDRGCVPEGSLLLNIHQQ